MGKSNVQVARNYFDWLSVNLIDQMGKSEVIKSFSKYKRQFYQMVRDFYTVN